MLRSVKKLEGFKIHAVDGEIGRVEDVYFDDEEWTVRYFVVRTGSWLFGREVLLSPISLEKIDWPNKEVVVKLTIEQVKNSPGVDTDKPISKQQEFEFSRYYGFPVYWGGTGLWGDAMHPGALFIPPEDQAEKIEEEQKQADHHLRSADEVIGYGIQAKDGKIGHVTDFYVDDGRWITRYFEIDTRTFLPGKHVIFSPKWVTGVDWAQAEVKVDMDKAVIENAPAFDASKPVTREYEETLFDYYGTVKYWLEEEKGPAD